MFETCILVAGAFTRGKFAVTAGAAAAWLLVTKHGLGLHCVGHLDDRRRLNAFELLQLAVQFF